MALPKNELNLSLDRARRWMIAAQCFGTDWEPGQAVEQTGFLRALGGVDVYLAMRARCRGLTRAHLDQVVARQKLLVLPAVRGCMYLVPRRYRATVLRLADRLTRARNQRDEERAGIQPGEIEKLAEEVLRLLDRLGAATTDALRRALPPGLVRSLGETGKRVGISSPLPPTLRRLEFQGLVERVLRGDRLDTERYQWRLVRGLAEEMEDLPEDPVELAVPLGRLFFRAAGLATVADFADWAGLGRRQAAEVVSRLALTEVRVEGMEQPCYGLAEERDRRESTAVDGCGWIPFEDNLIALHGGPRLLVPPEYHHMAVPVWGSSKMSTLGEARHMSFRSIVGENGIVGFWEYDPDEGVVWRLFSRTSDDFAGRVAREAEGLGRFVAEELGHARSHSLDTDVDLRRRADHIRSWWGR
jgi:hypothetical protein